jgi:divinyl chlorophyllide a 8-vinyl-reductase
MRIALFGATGTIGQATAKVLLAQGHEVVCPVRPTAGALARQTAELTRSSLAGTELRFIDAASLFHTQPDFFQRERIDAVISCIASRSGAPADAWTVDYRLHAELLQLAKAAGVKHFVLLSAICVQKPLLAFQQAKLAFENELVNSGLRYSIVRPTAFFKSLSGQLRRIQQGKSFLLFGDGQLTACKPISDQDLAQFIVSCLSDPQKYNRILPIGGPGDAITPLEQGHYLFKLTGQPPRFTQVPVRMLDLIIGALRIGGHLVPSLSEKAELAKIGRYYATESMLVWDPISQRYDADATPSFGSQTLFEFYEQLVAGKARVDLGEHAVF